MLPTYKLQLLTCRPLPWTWGEQVYQLSKVCHEAKAPCRGHADCFSGNRNGFSYTLKLRLSTQEKTANTKLQLVLHGNHPMQAGSSLYTALNCVFWLAQSMKLAAMDIDDATLEAEQMELPVQRGGDPLKRSTCLRVTQFLAINRALCTFTVLPCRVAAVAFAPVLWPA